MPRPTGGCVSTSLADEEVLMTEPLPPDIVGPCVLVVREAITVAYSDIPEVWPGPKKE